MHVTLGQAGKRLYKGILMLELLKQQPQHTTSWAVGKNTKDIVLDLASRVQVQKQI